MPFRLKGINMNDKELVAYEAAQLIENAMLVGLGTGSTADCFIEALARRVREDGLQITTAASSIVSAIKARSLQLPCIGIDQLNFLDFYVDGADEVTPDMTLLKGQGADLVREKLMAKASHKFIVLVDQGKLVSRIGECFPIPIEVMPFAWQLVKRSLEAVGGQGDLRPKADNGGLAVTSYGSLILDLKFPEELDSQSLNHILNNTPGVVEHGIFSELSSAIFMAENGQVQQRWQD